MGTQEELIGDFYQGLTELVGDAFPRTCANCGRVFESSQDFIAQTEAIRGRSGLTQYSSGEGHTAIYLFRNCVCGSTIMELFQDRRDMSERGQRIRDKFAQLLDILSAFGLEAAEARAELLKVLNGETSEVLDNLGFKVRKKAMDVQQDLSS